MECDFVYCIYNKQFNCTLDKNKMNYLAMCDDFVAISIDVALIDAEKERLIRYLDKPRNT